MKTDWLINIAQDWLAMSTEHVKHLSTNHVDQGSRTLVLFYWTLSPFPSSRSSRARMDRETWRKVFPPLVAARSRVGRESRLMTHAPHPHGLAGSTSLPPFSSSRARMDLESWVLTHVPCLCGIVTNCYEVWGEEIESWPLEVRTPTREPRVMHQVS